MEFTLNKSQRLVTNAIAKDESRLALTCVHIRKGIIEAANGWILVQKTIGYNGDEELLLKADEVARCRDSKQKDFEPSVLFKTDEVLDRLADRGKAVLATGKDKAVLEAQEGNFPDVDKLFPYPMNAKETLDRLAGKGLQEVFKIALSRQRLLEVLRCFDKDEIDTIRFHFFGSESPVAFEVVGVAKGMIMPMIVQW